MVRRNRREKTSRRAREERNFVDLFEEVVNRIMLREWIPEDEVRDAIQSLLRCLQFCRGGRFSDIDFSRLSTICAYIFRYGAHGAGLARCKILDVADNSDELDACLKKSKLSVVSLGGGPGNDALGLCSALYYLDFEGRLDITVVDAVPQWSRSVDILRQLITERDCGDASKLCRQNDVDLSFLAASLPGDPVKDGELYSVLEDADIILISKLFSIMDGKGEREKTIKKLRSKMKDGAIILLIDTPFHRNLWTKFGFDVEYCSDDMQPYLSSVTAERFGYDDRVPSKAQIYVLVKDLDYDSSDSASDSDVDSESEGDDSDSESVHSGNGSDPENESAGSDSDSGPDPYRPASPVFRRNDGEKLVKMAAVTAVVAGAAALVIMSGGSSAPILTKAAKIGLAFL